MSNIIDQKNKILNMEKKEDNMEKKEDNMEKKEDNMEKKEEEEEVKLNPSITIINSIKENWLSWIFILISVSIVSYPNCTIGLLSFVVFLFLAYFSHLASHSKRDVFTILHHYHHENDNWFSHISQILTELSFPLVFFPLYLIYGKIFFDEWILFLFAIFYSSVHNINYGIFRVNDVHYLHHKHMLTNIGPDICDVIFRTKNCRNAQVENTNHYIPNIIIGTIIVLIFKYFYYKHDFYKSWINFFTYAFLGCSSLFAAVSSIYLYFFYKK